MLDTIWPSANTLILVAVDLVAIALLALGLYARRHHRRDLAVSYIAVNVGVLAVCLVLSGSAASTGVGVGIGLFGVLSIIRLRSTELGHHEVAYYFAALALGLIAGLSADLPLALLLMGALVGVMALVDHRAFFSRTRQQIVVLDRAIPGEDAVRAHLEALLDADVLQVTVQQLDLVSDRTIVDVRYRLRDAAVTAAPRGGAHATPASPTNADTLAPQGALPDALTVPTLEGAAAPLKGARA